MFNAENPINILPNRKPATVIVANAVPENPRWINVIVINPTNINETYGVLNLFNFIKNNVETARSFAITYNSWGKINNIAFKEVNRTSKPPIAMRSEEHTS